MSNGGFPYENITLPSFIQEAIEHAYKLGLEEGGDGGEDRHDLLIFVHLIAHLEKARNGKGPPSKMIDPPRSTRLPKEDPWNTEMTLEGVHSAIIMHAEKVQERLNDDKRSQEQKQSG